MTDPADSTDDTIQDLSLEVVYHFIRNDVLPEAIERRGHQHQHDEQLQWTPLVRFLVDTMRAGGRGCLA
jgi:hypothetical protein